MDVESYGDAVLSAARETGLDEKSFTSEMPWALADTLRDDFILNCSGAFNIIYIMRIRIAEGEKQPPSVNQSYNQRPDLADAMSIPIVNSGT